MPPFSLLHEAWIPVATSHGERPLIRLDEISRPDILAIATGRPDCDISLTEFLIGLLSVAAPPGSDTEWRNGLCGAPPSADQLRAAFAPLSEALVLDGDGPRFFQDREEFEPDTPERKLKRTEQLFVDAPGENTIEENADHFVKRGATATLSRAGAAIALLTIQTMSPSGGPGKLTSIRGGGPLSSLIIPGGAQSLWHRLWANVTEGYSLGSSSSSLVFPWLVETRKGAKGGIKTLPGHVHRSQVFFGMPRRIRLIFSTNDQGLACDLMGIVDTVVVRAFADRAKGTDYGDWPKGHPLSPYKRKDADGPYSPVHLQSSRVGYREWLGIALGQNEDTRVPAQCVYDFRRRLDGHTKGDLAVVRRDARLLVAGYAMDNMKPLDFGEALMPLIVASSEATNGRLRALAERLIDAAQETAGLLLDAVKLGLFGKGTKADTASTVLSPIRDRFWADTEQPFFAAIHAALQKADAICANDADEASDAWRDISAAVATDWLRILRSHAERIFDDNVSLDDADGRRISDIVQARRQMLVSLAGYGAPGRRLFNALDLPVPAAKKPKADKSRKETTA